MATEIERTDADRMAGPPFEGLLRSFMAPRGVDLDAMSVSFLLFRTDNVTLSAMESAALRPNGLSHAGFVLMMTLWMGGSDDPDGRSARHGGGPTQDGRSADDGGGPDGRGIEIRQLAWVQRVSKSSIVSAVDTLERAGLVRRSRSESDKRLVRVELTDEGRRTIERVWEDWHACEKRIAGVLSREEQRTLASMLRRIDEAACGSVRQAPRQEARGGGQDARMNEEQ